jgi:DNA end-binding protein Ku
VGYRRVTKDDPGAPVDASWPPLDDSGEAESTPSSAHVTGEDAPTPSTTVRPRPETAPRPAEQGTREVAYEDLVRGYEVEPGRFALLEREDIERARPSRSSTIELEDFVELESIDLVYFEKTYYVAPRRDATNPYRLLLLALGGTRRVGIGRFVLRTKPHLVAVRPVSELVPPIEGDVSPREIRLAEQLVETLATDWDPDRYADEYREELLRIIAEKEPVGTAEPSGAPAPVEGSNVQALMEALRRSVEEAKSAHTDDERRRRTG